MATSPRLNIHFETFALGLALGAAIVGLPIPAHATPGSSTDAPSSALVGYVTPQGEIPGPLPARHTLSTLDGGQTYVDLEPAGLLALGDKLKGRLVTVEGTYTTRMGFKVLVAKEMKVPKLPAETPYWADCLAAQEVLSQRFVRTLRIAGTGISTYRETGVCFVRVYFTTPEGLRIYQKDRKEQGKSESSETLANGAKVDIKTAFMGMPHGA